MDSIIITIKIIDKVIPNSEYLLSFFLYPINIDNIKRSVDIINDGNLIPIALNKSSPIDFPLKEVNENIIAIIEVINDKLPMPSFFVIFVFSTIPSP